jgi:putative flippase GtrA
MVIQFAFYTIIGGFSALVNLAIFLGLYRAGLALESSALAAFFLAALVNYWLSIKLIFRHEARWKTATEFVVFLTVVGLIGLVDMYCTRMFVALGSAPWLAKTFSTALGLVLNFAARRFIVFPDKTRPDWKPQNPE